MLCEGTLNDEELWKCLEKRVSKISWSPTKTLDRVPEIFYICLTRSLLFQNEVFFFSFSYDTNQHVIIAEMRKVGSSKKKKK